MTDKTVTQLVHMFLTSPIAPGIPYVHCWACDEPGTHRLGDWPCTDTRAAIAGNEPARLRLVNRAYPLKGQS